MESRYRRTSWSYRAMSTAIILIALVLSTAPVRASLGSAGSGLSTTDRELLVDYLTLTQTKFLNSIDGLTEAQWNFRAGPDRWTIAEIADHITLGEGIIYSIVTEKVAKAGTASTDGHTIPDARVLIFINDRTNKLKAPEPVQPRGDWPSRSAIVEEFSSRRARSLEFVRTTSIDLRSKTFANPALKADIDGVQWVLLLGGHCERHVAQIEEVKEDPKYPH